MKQHRRPAVLFIIPTFQHRRHSGPGTTTTPYAIKQRDVAKAQAHIRNHAPRRRPKPAPAPAPSRARPALLPSSAPPPPSSAKYQRHRRTSTTTHHAAATPRASALPCSSCAAALVRPVTAPRQLQGPALRRPRPVPVPRPAPLRPYPPRCHLQQRKAAHTPKPASTTTLPAVPCQCQHCAAAASHAPSSPATGQSA